MTDDEHVHPDEGTLHAWLDGALDPAAAGSLDAHVSACAECQARVAEARGLIAGASRVVGLLDETPAPTIRDVDAPVESSLWRMLRVTPARASIAALLLVALGIGLTWDRVSFDSVDVMATGGRAVAGGATSTAPRAAEKAAAPAPDSLLASAISKRVEADHPARSLEPAPGIAVPSAPPSIAGAMTRLNSAPAREVAAARDSLSEARITAGAGADKLAAKVAVAKAAGTGCYRIESTSGQAATWQGVALPLEVSLASTVSSYGAPAASASADAVGDARYAIVPAAGGSAIGQWSRVGGDSLSIALKGSAPVVVPLATGETALNRMKDAIMVGAADKPLAMRSAAPAPAPVAARVVARKIDCPK